MGVYAGTYAWFYSGATVLCHRVLLFNADGVFWTLMFMFMIINGVEDNDLMRSFPNIHFDELLTMPGKPLSIPPSLTGDDY